MSDSAFVVEYDEDEIGYKKGKQKEETALHPNMCQEELRVLATEATPYQKRKIFGACAG